MKKKFSVFGLLLRGKSRKPLADARIEAWDKDLLFDDFLGSGTSDASGKFRIDFDSSRFEELFFDKRPDVFFRVYEKDELIFDSRESLIITIDSEKLELTIEVPAGKTTKDQEKPTNDHPMKDDKPSGSKPLLQAESANVREGSQLIVRGTHWPDCLISFEFSDKKEVRIVRAISGSLQGKKLRPAGDGSFLLVLAIGRTGGGKLQITAVSAHKRKPSAELTVEVNANPGIYPDAELKGFKLEKSFLRQEDFFRRRFGHIGFIPPNMRHVQLGSYRKLKKMKPGGSSGTISSWGGEYGDTSIPVPGVCNWTPIGPACVPHGQVAGSSTVSGRQISLAIDPVTPSVMFVGTAGAGIWKSTDSGQTWSPRTDYHMSMAIGSIAIAPNNHLRMLAGTGEFHHTYVGGTTYYGNGLLRSEDNGENWTEVTGAPFDRNEISRVLFDPTDAMSNRAYLSCTTGIYESPDGNTWNLLHAGSASELVAFEDPLNAGDLILIAAMYGSGLWRATRTAGVWGTWTQIVDPAIPASVSGRIARWQDAAQPRRLMFLFNTPLGLRIARTNDGSTWSEVTIRFGGGITDAYTQNGGAPAHKHQLTIPSADMIAAPAAHSYISTSAGAPAHTHTFSFTAADMQKLASGGGVNKTSDPDVTGHSHVISLSLAGQLDYNFVIAAHPTDNNKIYLGNVWLWRTDNGLVFNNISSGSGPGTGGVHADQHTFAFDPGNPAIVWAGNDGGLFRSTNGGDSWEARNRDLATLQYLNISSHPQWENVIIGGTQDNGTHRYGGHPAWKFSRGGDGGFTAIDQANPMRMYSSYIYSTFYRSDSAGNSWSYISGTIASAGDPVEFYPVFELDPSDQNVCYFGTNRLWRSPDNGTNWGAVSTALTGNITALAVHPSDPTTVYAGTSSGHVYRVQRTGADWTLANVTTTEITDTGLPAGTYTSDLAVDTGGTIWVTFSSVTWTEYTGEFTNNHVFRRTPGSVSWESRNTGLAMANPVNTIVIDPTNNNRIFIGSDLGVFRTEDAGGMWTIWDEGLPSVPVFHLNIFSPLRLLRAGTFGRGAWERPIDTAMCPLVDLYVRDHMLDSGRRSPSPDYVTHPFDPAVELHHWECADIKVDAPEGTPPALQSATAANDYIYFEADLQHRTARRNTTNRIYAQVHNRGVNAATNVKVRLFFADAHAGLPPLPGNFWTGGMPFMGTPSGTDWVAIGDTKTFPKLEAAEPGVESWDYVVPGTANKHSCLLMVVSCDENPIDGGGLFNVDQLVMQNKQVGLKNLNVENALPGSPMPEAPMMGFRSEFRNDGLADMVIHWGNLPKGTQAFFSFSLYKGEKPVLAPDEKTMKRLGLKPIEKPEKYFPEKRETRCGDTLHFDFKNAFGTEAHTGETLIVPGLHVFAKESVYVQFNLVLPKDTAPGTATFSIMQRQGKKVSGGCTYQLRIGKPEEKQ